jgi:hypothetical protein
MNSHNNSGDAAITADELVSYYTDILYTHERKLNRRGGLPLTNSLQDARRTRHDRLTTMAIAHITLIAAIAADAHIALTGIAATAAMTTIVAAAAANRRYRHENNRYTNAKHGQHTLIELTKLFTDTNRNARLTRQQLATYEQLLAAGAPPSTHIDIDRLLTTALQRTAAARTTAHTTTSTDDIATIGVDNLTTTAYWWPLTRHTLTTPGATRWTDTGLTNITAHRYRALQRHAADTLRAAEHTYGTATLETARTLAEDGTTGNLNWDELLNFAATLTPQPVTNHT